MRLSQHPSIGNRKIPLTTQLQDTPNLSQMFLLKGMITHMFYDVVGYDNVKCLVLKWKSHPSNLQIIIPIKYLAIVHHINSCHSVPHVRVRSEVTRYSTSACPNFQDAYISSTLRKMQQMFNLPGFCVTR